MKNYYEEIGKRIKIAREDRGLTQEQLGEKLGFTKTAINLYEKGKRRISIDDLKRISTILGKPLSFFLGESIVPMETISTLIQKPLADFLPIKQVPLLGTIRAGASPYSEADILGYVSIDKELDADFAFKVRDDSMSGAGIMPGDIAICKKVDAAEPGQLAVAFINGDEVAVRYIISEDGLWKLRAANPQYEDVPFSPSEKRIHGIVVLIQKKPPALAERVYAGQTDDWLQVREVAAKYGISPEKAKRLLESFGRLMESEQEEAVNNKEKE
ncbi:LexA family protein [Desulfofundulus salinus]|uniref:Helix-turn-helix domain-containing protein n=1 Tax=Desulfofundulus salinus TaxID=2419843 RepID=A0A494WWQ0_9FIRM|nr:S24 family peptidase [Desulfofundulus salinum]RKO67373.1 helix-turn-helix domain-containing protein [Desulfofundulus salinum]